MEDDFPTVVLLKDWFEPIGLSVVHTGDYMEALKMCDQKVDIAMVDIVINGYMTGVSLIRLLKTFHRHVPVIAFTGWVDRELQKACLEAGCDDFILKPIDLDKLSALFRNYLGAGASNNFRMKIS